MINFPFFKQKTKQNLDTESLIKHRFDCIEELINTRLDYIENLIKERLDLNETPVVDNIVSWVVPDNKDSYITDIREMVKKEQEEYIIKLKEKAGHSTDPFLV